MVADFIGYYLRHRLFVAWIARAVISSSWLGSDCTGYRVAIAGGAVLSNHSQWGTEHHSSPGNESGYFFLSYH
jgi:hypothetical protein